MSTLSTPRLDHNSTINENKNINNSRDNRILNDPGIQSLHSLPRTNTTFKNLIIPEHSSLPSPLSPPLSVSPSSSGSSMADFIATQAQHGFPSFSSSSSSSLPPFHPSSNNSSHSINDISHPHLNSVSASPSPLATIQTSPEAWLAHAAEQRRHLSSASFSSTTSSSMSHLVSPQSKSQSPVPLEFGESEQIQDGIQNVKDPYHQSTIIPLDHDHDHDHEEDEQEPELNMNLRPSELRASLMARAKRSSARLQKKRSESMPIDMLDLRLSMQSNQSYNSVSTTTFDSRLSTQSSSSSISAWAPRERSSSVSSHTSNDSVNLDALIAEGSDINEECPLELEEGDEVEWSREQRATRNQYGLSESSGGSMQMTTESELDMNHYGDQNVEEFWEDPEASSIEDEEHDETLKDFSRLAVETSIQQISGLSLSGDMRSRNGSISSKFPDGRNPFDLEVDFMDSPSGLRSPDRSSNASNYSNSSSHRGGSSRLPSPGASRLPGAPGTSGLKAPSTRLAQPATRSMLAQPKTGPSSGAAAPRTGIVRPGGGLPAPRAGSQVPKSGLQTPKTGLQAPRAGSSSALTARASIPKPGTSGITPPGRTTANAKTTTKVAVSTSRPPSSASGIVKTGTATAKSQITSPSGLKKPTTTANRQSLLPAPSSIPKSGSVGTGRASSSTSPKRVLTSPNHLTSPTRAPSDRSSSSSYLISPTTPASRRLSSAAGTSHLARPRSATLGGRTLSMHGSNGLQHHEEYETNYSTLTPPQSPSSAKAGTKTGIPRSGIAAPSRLVAPSVSTVKTAGRMSPSPLSAGSNYSGSQISIYSRPHTPTSSLPTRIPSGLVSPRAGRH